MDALFHGDGGLRVVPVRVLVGAAPPSQLPIPPLRPNGEDTLGRKSTSFSMLIIVFIAYYNGLPKSHDIRRGVFLWLRLLFVVRLDVETSRQERYIHHMTCSLYLSELCNVRTNTL